MLTEEQRKKLLAKRKYYSEHPEKARKEYINPLFCALRHRLQLRANI